MKAKDVKVGLVVWDWKGNVCEVIYILPPDIGGYILRDVQRGTKRYADRAGKIKPRVLEPVRQFQPELIETAPMPSVQDHTDGKPS